MAPQRPRDETEDGEPARPPEHDRGIELNPLQLIGLPALALIPVLAMAGVFGESWTSKGAESPALQVLVDHPSRFRARLSKPLAVLVHNRSGTSLDTVRVTFDSTYMDRFTGISFVPDADEAYVVSLTDVKPGERRRVQLEIDGGRMGRHSGRVVVSTRSDTTVVPLRTMVLP